MIRTSLPLTKLVEKYTRNNYDIKFSAIVARVLSDKYQELKVQMNDPDNIFSALVAYVSHGDRDKPKVFWAR